MRKDNKREYKEYLKHNAAPAEVVNYVKELEDQVALMSSYIIELLEDSK